MSHDFDPAMHDPNRKHDDQTVKPAGRHDDQTVKPAGRLEAPEDKQDKDSSADNDDL